MDVRMASIYELKPRFQNLLRPVTRSLAERGITANQVTVGAAVLSLLAGAWVSWQPGASLPLLCIPLVLFVRMALNAIDGMLAREHAMKSDLGAFLNELGDVVSDAALYLPLALIEGVLGALVVIAVVLGIVGELAGVLAVQIGGERRYDGPLGKSDRAFVFGALSLAFGVGISGGMWLTVVLLAVNALAIVTIVNRVQRGLRGTTAWRYPVAAAPLSPAVPPQSTTVEPAQHDPVTSAAPVRLAEEARFRAGDGTEIFYRVWPPK